MLGGGAVGRCAHLLVACQLVVYDTEKKTYTCHVSVLTVGTGVGLP